MDTSEEGKSSWKGVVLPAPASPNGIDLTVEPQ